MLSIRPSPPQTPQGSPAMMGDARLVAVTLDNHSASLADSRGPRRSRMTWSSPHRSSSVARPRTDHPTLRARLVGRWPRLPARAEGPHVRLMSVLGTIERRLSGFARKLLGRGASFDRSFSPRPSPTRTPTPSPDGSGPNHPPAHADERTIRRVGEAQLGGMSSAESREAYERGENPGGLHHGGRGPASPRSDGE